MTPTTTLCLRCSATGALAIISRKKPLTGRGNILWMSSNLIPTDYMPQFLKDMLQKVWSVTMKLQDIGRNTFLPLTLLMETAMIISGKWVIPAPAVHALKFISTCVTMRNALK